jgi:hypothetical protein
MSIRKCLSLIKILLLFLKKIHHQMVLVMRTKKPQTHHKMVPYKFQKRKLFQNRIYFIRNQIVPEEDHKAIEMSYNKQKVDEEVLEYSTSSTFCFFLKHSYRDVGRKKFHFCLSFCSVFIVVWSALVINTLVEQGPIIFLKLAEGDVG